MEHQPSFRAIGYSREYICGIHHIHIKVDHHFGFTRSIQPVNNRMARLRELSGGKVGKAQFFNPFFDVRIFTLPKSRKAYIPGWHLCG